MVRKKVLSLRLSDTAREILEEVAERRGVSLAAAAEMVIREWKEKEQ